jgi:hypothetical protein
MKNCPTVVHYSRPPSHQGGQREDVRRLSSICLDRFIACTCWSALKGPDSIAADHIPTEQGKIGKDCKPRPALQHVLHAGLLSDATFYNDFLPSRDLKQGAGTFWIILNECKYNKTLLWTECRSSQPMWPSHFRRQAKGSVPNIVESSRKTVQRQQKPKF